MNQQQHAQRLIDRLRRLADLERGGQRFVLPDGCVSKLDVVERRLLAAIQRDETASTDVDGYPTGRLGSGGEDAPQSRTEGAGLAHYIVDGDIETGEGEWVDGVHDPHHELVDAATQALQRGVDAIADLLEKLEAIDRLAKIHRTDPSGHCRACDRWVEGTANDRLRSGYCEADYRAWLRAGRPDRVAFERQRQGGTAA